MRLFKSIGFSHQVLAGGVAGICLAWAGTASAFTPKWLECDGQVVTTQTVDGKTQSTSAPAHDFYVYDDDAKNFYKYSDKRKAQDIEPVTSYTDKEIKWASQGSSANASRWQGSLNRTSLVLTINYQEKGAMMVWTQQCKAAQPQP